MHMCSESRLMCVCIGSDEGSGNCAHVLYLKPRWLSACVPAQQALLSARAAPRAATRQLVRSPFLRNLFLSLSCTHCPTSAHKRVHAHTTPFSLCFHPCSHGRPLPPFTSGASSCSGSLCAAGKHGQEGATSSAAATCTDCAAGKYGTSPGADRDTHAHVCMLTRPRAEAPQRY